MSQQQNPEVAAKLKNEGNTFYASKKFSEAIDCYTKAYNLQPSK
jgi:hypothetical protein